MRAVVQRVKSAEVRVAGAVVGKIGAGLLVYLGVADSDGEADVAWMAGKVAGLRVMEDCDGKMNESVGDVGGEALVVSQFTLYGDVRKGMRPSFTRAAPPERARALYEAVAAALRARGLRVATGEFQAMMEVDAINWGPVTILLSSEKDF